jgi:hypothetical protein
VLLQAFVANIADLCPEYCANITMELLQENSSPEAPDMLRLLQQQLYTKASKLGAGKGGAAQPQQVHQGQQPASQGLVAAGEDGVGGSFSHVSTLTTAGAGQEGRGAAAAAVTPAASAVASGAGMFIRHDPTDSEDLAAFVQTLGGYTWCCLVLLWLTDGMMHFAAHCYECW